MKSGREETYIHHLKIRWLRIGLPYYATILICLGVIALCRFWGIPHPNRNELTIRQLVTHLTFTHGFWLDTLYGVNEHLWTIALIFQFYLVFPLVFRVMMRIGGGWFLAGVLSLTVAANIVLWLKPDFGYLSYGFLPFRCTSFSFGMLLALWYDKTTVSGQDRRFMVPTILIATVLLGLGWANYRRIHLPGSSILFGAAYSLFMAAILASARSHGALARWSSHPVLTRFGAMSYSTYLIHQMPMVLLITLVLRSQPNPSYLTDLFIVVVMPAVMLVTAWIFYSLVESPINRWIKEGASARRVPSVAEGLGARPQVGYDPPITSLEKA